MIFLGLLLIVVGILVICVLNYRSNAIITKFKLHICSVFKLEFETKEKRSSDSHSLKRSKKD